MEFCKGNFPDENLIQEELSVEGFLRREEFSRRSR